MWQLNSHTSTDEKKEKNKVNIKRKTFYCSKLSNTIKRNEKFRSASHRQIQIIRQATMKETENMLMK